MSGEHIKMSENMFQLIGIMFWVYLSTLCYWYTGFTHKCTHTHTYAVGTHLQTTITTHQYTCRLTHRHTIVNTKKSEMGFFLFFFLSLKASEVHFDVALTFDKSISRFQNLHLDKQQSSNHFIATVTVSQSVVGCVNMLTQCQRGFIGVTSYKYPICSQ